jgi:arylsulfatase A-like enzyme
MRNAWSVGGLILAGWIGVAAGLFDSLASFLHPTPLAAMPLAMTVSALVSLVFYVVLETSRRRLGRAGSRSHPGFPLGAVIGFWVAFFLAYFVTTSTRPVFASGKGVVGGLLAAAAIALLAMVLTYRAVATFQRRKPPPALSRAGVPTSALLLMLVILVAPILALVQAQRDGSHPADAGDPPRGFVLVSLDAARGDRISGLGYHRPTTPHIDAILPGSVAFRRAYVEMPASGPGHASMLSGLPPAAHGVIFNNAVLDDEVQTLAERLHSAGFSTAAFLNNYYLESRFGFDQGFDTFINQYRATHLKGCYPQTLLRGLGLFHFWHRLTQRPGQKNDDTIEGALAWLRHRPPGDFFVFLHIMDPHSPYDPPADLRGRFYAPTGEPLVDSEELRCNLDQMSPAEVQALCDLYDGGVALADRKVGRLITELKALNLFDSTLLVITADHGEELAGHGNTFDHGQLWDGNLHVPLVISYPDRLPGGTVVEHPVSATSITPTALALLDVPYEEQGTRGFHQSLLTPNSWQVAEPSYVFATGGLGKEKASCVLYDRFKLVALRGRTVGFYDLADDPGEMRDLSAALAAADTNSALARDARHLEEALQIWQDKCARGLVTGGVRSLTDLDRETIKRLRALGYVN